MTKTISRRKIAAHIADQLIENDSSVIEQLAAYLVDHKQTRATEVLIRDIESELADRGVVLATVESAHPLSAAMKTSIKEVVTKSRKGARVILREIVSPDLLGGVRITTPGEELDATLRHRLTNIMKAKI